MSGYAGRDEAVQDQDGIWWSQDPMTGSWSFWNGQDWQKMPDASPRIVQPKRTGRKKSRQPWSCLLTLFSGGLIALIVLGGITMVAYNFFPDYHILPGQGDTGQILRLGGGGFLSALLGLFMLYRAFRAIFVRAAVVDAEIQPRREKPGCGTVLNSFGQLIFGTLFLAGGLGVMAFVFYQEVLPWLGW